MTRAEYWAYTSWRGGRKRALGASRSAIRALMPLWMPSARAGSLAVVTIPRPNVRGSWPMITARSAAASSGRSAASTEK